MGMGVFFLYLISALLLGVATNLDNMLIGFSAGMRGKKITLAANGAIALSSGVVSYLLCRLAVLATSLGHISNYLGGGLLIAIGVWPLLPRSMSEEGASQVLADSAQNHLSVREVLALSLALAFNCLPASFAAGLTGLSPEAAALAVALCSLCFVWLGGWLGQTLKNACSGRLLTLLSSAAMVSLGLLEIFI